MKRKIFTLFILTTLVFISFPYLTHAQTGTLKGIVIDEKTKEPIPFASVVIEKDGKIISGTIADFDGNYTITKIPEGTYDLKAMCICYNTIILEHIFIKTNSVIIQNIVLTKKEMKLHVDYIPSYYPPLISRDPLPSGQTYTSEEINKMAW